MIKNSKVVETLSDLHGGKGEVSICRKVNDTDSIRGIDMFAEVTIDVGASIGYHLHEKDAEAYYVIQGQGIFMDDCREKKKVYDGDLCLIEKGQGHGMENIGDIPLKMIAIVY